MNGDDFRRLLSADPFEPFDLYVSDGNTYEVSDPSQASLQPRGRVIDWRLGGYRRLITVAHIASAGFRAQPGEMLFLRKR